MAIQEGQKLPEATLHMMQEGRPAAVTTDDLFAGKKVVLFAVPGAFTPTCSQALPFQRASDEIGLPSIKLKSPPAKSAGPLPSS